MFFLAPPSSDDVWMLRSARQDDQRHDVNRAVLLGCVPSTIDQIPEVDAEENADEAVIEAYPTLFGALSEGGLAINVTIPPSTSDDTTRETVVQTKLDVPYAYLRLAETHEPRPKRGGGEGQSQMKREPAPRVIKRSNSKRPSELIIAHIRGSAEHDDSPTSSEARQVPAHNVFNNRRRRSGSELGQYGVALPEPPQVGASVPRTKGQLRRLSPKQAAQELYYSRVSAGTTDHDKAGSADYFEQSAREVEEGEEEAVSPRSGFTIRKQVKLGSFRKLEFDVASPIKRLELDSAGVDGEIYSDSARYDALKERRRGTRKVATTREDASG